MMKIIRKYQRFISVSMIFMLFNTTWPSLSMAITGSSTMPEYRSFEPVSSANMVNMLDGSFSYNIPLMDVPNGYPLNISYNSNDVNNEAQASWVGLGWTLNPGAINRVKRGVPDEFDKENVKYHTRIENNWTVGIGATAGFELFSKSDLLGGGLSLGSTIRYNNFQGFSSSLNLGSSFSFGPVGIGSLNLSYASNGGFGFSPELNPSVTIQGKVDKEKERELGNDQLLDIMNDAYTVEEIRNDKDLAAEVSVYEQAVLGGDGRSQSKGNIGFSAVNHLGLSFPQNKENGQSYRFEFTVGPNVTPAQTDVEVGANASYVWRTTKEEQDRNTYGYFYSHKAMDDDNAVMDYKTERENIYEKRDKVLGYPIAESDIFSVTGEGVGGSFRAFRNRFGYYKKNQVINNLQTINVGADLNLPSGIWPGGVNATGAAGGSLHGGNQRTSIGNWDQRLRSEKYEAKGYKFSSENELEFRFSNDLAGNIDNAGEEEPVRANGKGRVLGLALNMDLVFEDDLNNDGRGRITDKIGKSIHIKMSKNEDFSKRSSVSGQGEDMQYLVHTQDLHIIDESDNVIPYDRDGTLYGNKGIGEFMMHNADGVKYIYGLPMHTKNEKQLSYSTDKLGGLTPENSKLIRPNSEQADDLEENASRKQGYEQDAAYATQNLLTEIVSPDYIDRTMDGPTPDDFGSYTKFNYKRVAGGDKEWYNYRSPYEGMAYTQGSLTDKKDNMASVNWGQKELYYVHSVVSKTHVAIFTLEDRDDGCGALSGMDINTILAPDYTKGGTRKKLKKLTKIDLYPISSCTNKGGGIYEPKENAVAIKTVHFDYDYSLCPNLPNNINKGSSDKTKTGKLTLKRIWFDYGGKQTSKVSPYEFKYEYPVHPTSPSSKSAYADSKYGGKLDLHYKFSADAQNPEYSVFNTNRWGNYFNFSEVRTALKGGLPSDGLAPFFPFNYQGDVSYDPAAYKLKQIVLPSGGEIHVQYEQGDYQYVQDKRAMVMVPLHHKDDGHKGRFYLDLEKIGVKLPTDVTKRNELVRDLFEPMNDDGDRMYFNFLYRLVGSGAPDVTRRQSEYIEGYVRISSYGIVGDDVFFSFSEGPHPSRSGEWVKNVHYRSGLKPSRKDIPQKVCKSFYKSQRVGKTSTKSSGGVDDSGNKQSLVNRLLEQVKDLPDIQGVCAEMEPSMSYVRVQMPIKNEEGSKPKSEFSTTPIYAKKGGSVRVKRLLLVDHATNLEDHSGSIEPFIYGNEYIYKTSLDGNGAIISSGVATFEPQNGRRENALVKPIDKLKQTRFNALLFGRDMYGMEEPFGEALYPSPSVGYSKVIMKNIHDGKTSTGYEEHEYFTCKDFPFRAEKTPINLKREQPISVGASFGKEKSIGFSYQRKAPYMFQGYSFILNDMHGKPKSIKKYSGLNDNGKPALITSQSFEYSKPGEAVSVMDESRSTYDDVLGTEGEVYAELNQIKDFGSYGSAAGEVTLGGWTAGPFPGITVLPTLTGLSVSISDMSNRTHVTTKVIRYATVLKSKRATANGITSVTYNDIFDKYTGSPVKTRTLDDFDNEYQNVDIKATWMYPNMRSTAENAGATVAGGTIQVENGVTYIAFDPQTCGALDNFTRGDLLEVKPDATTTNNTNVYLYHTDEPDHDNNRIAVLRSGYSKDELTAGQVTGQIKVIRSGYTNELNVSTGGYSTHTKKGQNPAKDIKIYGEDNVPFIKDLNTALDGIQDEGKPTTLNIVGLDKDGNFNNVYENISLGLDNCILDDVCESGAKLTNVEIDYIPNTIDNTFSLSVKSFDVVDNNNVTKRVVRPEPTASRPRPIEVVVAPRKGRLQGEEVLSRSSFYSNVGSLTTFTSILDERDYKGCDAGPSGIIANDYNSSVSIQKKGQNYDIGLGETHDEGLEIGDIIKWDVNQSSIRYKNRVTSYVSLFGESYSFTNNHSGEHVITESDLKFFNNSLYYKLYWDGNWPASDKEEEEWHRFCLKVSPKPSISFEGSECDKNLNMIIYNSIYTRVYTSAKLIDLSTNVVQDFGRTRLDYGRPLRENVIIEKDGREYELQIITEQDGSGLKRVTTYKFKSHDCRDCNSYIVASPSSNSCFEMSSDLLNNKSSTPVTFTRSVFTGVECGTSNDFIWHIQKEGETNKLIGPVTESTGSFTYDFVEPGDYNVFLTVKNRVSGVSQPIVKLPYILKDCRIPKATVSVTNPMSCPNKEVTFDAIPEVGDVAIAKYEWFVDGVSVGNDAPQLKWRFNDCKKGSDAHKVKVRVSNLNNTDDNISESPEVAYAGNHILACHPIFECSPSFPLEKDRAVGTNGTFTEAHGGFSYNTNNGSFVYRKVTCPNAYKYPCFSLCGKNPVLVEKKTITNVVAASATTFGDDWDYDDAYYPGGINDYLNDYETGRKGNWRPKAQFVYRDDITQGKNYTAGTFTMTLFDWENQDNNDATKWVNTSNTLAYSPNGEPTLDVNILGVYSTSKYGYNGTLPVLVAQNANDHTVAYESFENLYDRRGKKYFEDGFEYKSSEATLVSSVAHTGKYSLELQSGAVLNLPAVNIQDNRGLVSRVWIKNTESPDALKGLLTLTVGTNSAKMTRISSGGEWQLYEAIVPTSGESYEAVSIGLSGDYDGKIYFDDFRIQPLESEMVCYVYDEAQRLIAVLDDQHYAMLYQYNTEGVLVRKLKETVQGVKTISETQYNTKGVQRNTLK